MAYLFNSLSDTGEDGEANKQNIFGGQQTDQGVTSTPGGTPGNDTIQKTSSTSAAPASSSAGGSSSSPAQPAKKAAAGYNPQAQSDAYASAASSMRMPTQSLNAARGSLNAGEQALQEKANAYQSKAQDTAKGFELDKDTIAGAAAGSQDAYQKTAQRLSGKSPDLFGSFEGLGGGDQPNIQNIRDPGSLYRAESGPNYSRGQSRFDAAMLRRNPEFIQQQQTLLGQEKALKEKNAKAQTDETKKAQDYLAQQYADSTKNIKDQLGGYANQIVSTARQKETAEDARRAALDPVQLGMKEQQELKQKIKEDLSHADPRSAEYRSLKYLDDQYDLGNFVNVDRDTDWREFIDQGAASGYNRIQGLLGNADMLTASQSGPGDASSFNEKDAYQNILSQLQGKRSAADAEGQQKLAAIQAAAEARVPQTQAQIKSQYEAMLPQYQAMRNAQNPAGGQRHENGFVITDTGNVVLPQYQEQPLSWQSVLTPDEIAQLNDTQADLGVLNPVNYQQGANPYAGNKALQDQIYQWQKTNNPLPAASPEIPVNRPMVPQEKPGTKLANNQRKTLFNSVR